MPFIGQQPLTGAYSKLDAITTSATATYNLLLNGGAYSPASANHLLVSLNGVMQAPQDSFTVSGSTIIFDSALTSSDNIDFIMALGDVLNIGTPSDGTVTAAKIGSGAVTASKIGSSAVTASKIGTGAVSQTKLASNVAGNGPAFSAYQINGSANQSISSDVWTKALLDTEEFDTNNNFASGRFTPTVAGYYQINGSLLLRNGSASAIKIIGFYKNGSLYKQGTQIYFNGNYYIAADCFGMSSLMYMNGSTDYVELYAYIGSSAASIGYGSAYSWFNGSLVRAA